MSSNFKTINWLDNDEKIPTEETHVRTIVQSLQVFIFNYLGFSFFFRKIAFKLQLSWLWVLQEFSSVSTFITKLPTDLTIIFPLSTSLISRRLKYHYSLSLISLCLPINIYRANRHVMFKKPKVHKSSIHIKVYVLLEWIGIWFIMLKHKFYI